MSVEHSETIDVITSTKLGVVVLGVSDHFPWAPFESHREALLTKLDSYFTFIASGQLVDAYPDAVGKPLEIHVYCKYRPTSDALNFLAGLESQAQTVGASLNFFPVPNAGYCDDAT